MSLFRTYAIDIDKTLYISDNDGQSYSTSTAFVEQFGAASIDEAYVHVHKYNYNKVFVASTYDFLGITVNRISRSFDGGQTVYGGTSPTPGNWQQIALGDDWTLGDVTDPDSVSFASLTVNRIWFISYKYIYKSNDGGYSFNGGANTSLENILKDSEGIPNYTLDPLEYARDLYFYDSGDPNVMPTTGIICVGNNLYKTTDSGGNWTELQTLPVGTGMSSAVIDGTGLIINVLDSSNIYRSIDGGVTWDTILAGAIDLRSFSPCLDDADTIYTHSGNVQGTFYKSTDFGETWSTITSSGFNSIRRFFRGDTCTTGVAHNDFNLLRTNNGGSAYTNISTSPNRILGFSAALYDCGCPPDGLDNGADEFPSQFYDSDIDKCITGDKCCVDAPETCDLDCVESDPLPCCIKLTSCVSNGPPIYTDESLTPGITNYIGQVINISGSSSCYLVTLEETICENPEAVTVTAFFEECFDCSPVYQLNACPDYDYGSEVDTGPIYTNNPLFANYVGDIVGIWSTENIKYRACYIVGIADFDSTPIIDFTEDDIQGSYNSCITCGYYKLTSCTDKNGILYSQDDSLDPYVDLTGGLTDDEQLPQVQAYIYGVSTATVPTHSLYKTEDSGQNWELLSDFMSLIGNPSYYNGVVHVNKFDPEIFVYAACNSQGSYDPIIVTTDTGGYTSFIAGGNYTNINNDLTGGTDVSLGTLQTRFATRTQTSLFMIGREYLYKGSYPGNGTATWNYSNTLNTILSTTVDTEEYRDIYFASPTVGILSIGTNIYITESGGNSWTASPSVPVSTGIKSVVIDNTGQIINLLEGPVSGSNSIWRSTDGGTSWTELLTTVPSRAIRFNPCLDDSTVLGIEYSHVQGPTTYLKSEDFGATWTSFTTNTHHILFLANDCQSVGVGSAPSTALVTDNGGVTFTIPNTPLMQRYWHSAAGSYSFDQCYSVEFINGVIDEPLINNPFTISPYQDCECCLYQEPEPEFVKYSRVIPEPVREFYRLVQSRCVVDTYVKFGKAFFGEYMKEAEGITTCVDVDNDKLWMKHKLQELDKLYDETACAAAESETEEDCDEPEGFDPAFG